MKGRKKGMSHQDTFPSEIFDIIQEIADLSIEGNFLFRGEPKHHCKISSTLYRECERIIQDAGLEVELSDFNIENIESKISDQVRAFMTTGEQVSDLSILTQLQHYESQTNLIDFTTDFNIALFFACDGQPDENGRIIVQKRNLVLTEQPSGIEHRILAQKSVFVRPKRGYIDPNEAHYKVVCIPAKLKEDVLRYLRNTNGITTEKIYNDIHGYIRTKDIHKNAYNEFYIALVYQGKAENVVNPEAKQELWDKAIERYGKVIEHNANFHPAYANRSTLYWNIGEYMKAKQDRLRAWEMYPEIAINPDTYRESKGAWSSMVIQDPISALNRILDSHDYLEYDERNSDGIVRLRVKVKDNCLDAERDSQVMFHINNELELATDRYYIPILNPMSGSPSQEERDKKWTYFTLHEAEPPSRIGNT